MRVGARFAVVVGLSALVAAGGCSNPLGRQYEYEEQLYLDVNGSATVIVDASFPAFVALRGLPLDPAPRALTDRDEVRRVFESAGCHVASVGQGWRRSGRRFIQVRISTDDVRKLADCKPLAWSTYGFDAAADRLHYHQRIGAAAGGNPGAPNWDGSEIVGFKLHLPSRILDHNVKRLDSGEPGAPERGNILTWEQRLTDRRAGQPIDLDVTIEAQSILYRTLWLFAGALMAALAAIAVAIWATIRRGRARVRAAASRPPA